MCHVPHFILFLIALDFMTGSHEGLVFSGVDNCFTEESSIICEHSLPKVLPENVSSVIVKDFLHVRINNETFTHTSWMSTQFLDITVKLNVKFFLYDNNFFPLKSLKTLGIHSPDLAFNDQKQILRGLTKLQSLNLSSCYYLNADALLTILETHERLDTLILDQYATSGSRYFVINTAFVEMISKMKLRKLSLSGCNLLFVGPIHTANRSFHLTDLNISNTTLIIYSNTSLSKILIILLSHLKSLDLSFIQSRFLDIDYSVLSPERGIPKCNESTNIYVLRLFTAEHLKLNGMFSRILEINNSFVDLSKCKINLKSLQLRSNNMHVFNATIFWPNKMHLYDLDLSSNGLEYLSPYAFGSISSLEFFHLADNKLHLMSSFREFQYLFSPFKKLLHLNLSHNLLSWLPFNVFSNNINLTVLDLSHNELASVSFEIRHLINLRFLNIENNKILYIDGADFSNLRFFIQTVLKPIEISFAHNPLLCSCKSKQFITWLSLYIQKNKVHTYVCALNGKKIPVDDNAVENVKFLCIRSKIVIAAVSTGIATICGISLVIAVVVYRKRRQRKARKRANFLDDFKIGLLQQKFLCFLSYSSDDDGPEISYVYENLNESLKALTEIEQEVVCFGDRRFNLGFPIIDEILRCISESCVAVFVATNNFCESHWCQMELREAYELDKPIILICKEDIDLTIMPPLMLKVFRQFTRAKLVTRENGQTEMVPDFEQLSNSILKHAAMRFEEVMN